MNFAPQGYNDDLRLAHVLADSVDAQTMDRFKALDFAQGSGAVAALAQLPATLSRPM